MNALASLLHAVAQPVRRLFTLLPRHLRTPLAPTAALLLCAVAGWGQEKKPEVLQTDHYRVFYDEKHERIAHEVIQVAEQVWPTLAKAYDSYDNYQRIDIRLVDQGDYANGYAIYTVSQVVLYVPHLNWLMRGRANWVGNVTTHELAHVFSLRRKAYLALVDAAYVSGYTFNQEVNWSIFLPWLPLAAPNWWVEGIAQFEAEEHGWDVWDSQRDMVVRDAWLTGTLPTLGQIETFDGDWIQGERVYNTGFAFLLFLKERYGAQKVRRVAEPKPFFHLGGAIETVFGKSLPQLYEEWKKSLADRYATFQDLEKPVLADPEITGSMNSAFAITSDGKTIAWIGNGDRIAPMDWIYWKDIGKSSDKSSGKSARSQPAPDGDLAATAALATRLPAQRPFLLPSTARFQSHPAFRQGGRRVLLGEQGEHREPHPTGRSDAWGNEGLEFNAKGDRLLTVRAARYSGYLDIWEYEYRRDVWHRLTWKERASMPSYHPAGDGTIVFSKFEDGSSNVAVLRPSGKVDQLTRFRQGQQVYTPRFTPKGDSIVFVLGHQGKEAIASLPADALPFDPFESQKDSSAFADSLMVAQGTGLTFITDWQDAAYRGLRFQGDTLVYSSNGPDKVYNVFALAPGDSAGRQRFRLTQARTLAVDPVLAGGTLYYQGFEKQHFRIYKQPLAFAPDSLLPPATDTLSTLRPKLPDYSKVLDKGEPTTRRVAWDITPFLSISPQFLDDTTLTDLNLGAGIDVAVGPASGGVSNSVHAELSKKVDAETPLDYTLAYYGGFAGIPTWHTKFAWTPNFNYSLAHMSRRRKLDTREVYDFDGGAEVIAVDDRYTELIDYEYDVATGGMDLPMSGTWLGPGQFYASYGTRYWRMRMTYDFREYATLTSNLTGQTEVFEQDLRVYHKAPLHQHWVNQLNMQWILPKLGTALPQYFGVYAGASNWWARYATESLAVDSLTLSERALDGEAVGLFALEQKDFEPWQLDFALFGALSHGEHASLGFTSQVGFFTHKFPSTRDPVHVNTAGDTTYARNPQSNLWILTYRLGLDLMPGYPYNFYYRGRDILEGTSMGWTRVNLDFPFKVRQFLGYPSPFSSLNQVNFSFMANAGAVLNQSPDRIYKTLENGEHNLLMDFGARVSLGFLFYHQLPMTLYAQIFQPYNQLKAKNMFLGDYLPPSLWQDALDNPGKYNDLRDEVFSAVKDPRYYIGLTMGLF